MTLTLAKVNASLKPYSVMVQLKVGRFSVWDLKGAPLGALIDGNFANLESAYSLGAEYVLERYPDYTPLIDPFTVQRKRAR